MNEQQFEFIKSTQNDDLFFFLFLFGKRDMNNFPFSSIDGHDVMCMYISLKKNILLHTYSNPPIQPPHMPHTYHQHQFQLHSHLQPHLHL